MASGVFGLRGKRLRDAALMGMTAGLAAFFGVALGGSLFALEARPQTMSRHGVYGMCKEVFWPGVPAYLCVGARDKDVGPACAPSTCSMKLIWHAAGAARERAAIL